MIFFLIKNVFIHDQSCLTKILNQCFFRAHGTAQSNKKRRFNLGEYQRVKKQVIESDLLKKALNEQKIKESRLLLQNQEAELQEIAKKLHSTQALISKKKRKVYIFMYYIIQKPTNTSWGGGVLIYICAKYYVLIINTFH
jgi:hypothetical protein